MINRLTKRSKKWISERHGDAYQKERLFACKEEEEGGRARVRTDEERVLRCG